MKFKFQYFSLFCALFTLMILAACAETRQARMVEPEDRSGFLGGEYASLERGTEDQALLRHVKPGTDFKNYKMAKIAPVTVWTSSDSELAGLPPQERKQLADRFNAHLTNEISKIMPVTTQAGPNTLDIQVALTDAEKSRPVLDTISSVMPVGLAASAVKEGFTGQASFTGSTGMEIRVFDANTGEVLATAVDKRVGSKQIGGMTKEWADTDAAMEYWAELLAYRICMERGQSGCRAPKA